ncbi:uncharacterized protein [Aegilops tauschii subsp. strangulata]|uniref:uncharacterized protein n=1 Tax=Aegilops tauschii subsp. strangulata TaxID=200361 RepID=UPI003CC8964D
MEKLGIKEKQLLPSRTVFHGIIPGLSGSPIGKVKINVMFGGKDHFCREPIWFEVVDLDSPYHTLLGWPALDKFMAGIITIAGDYQKSAACATATSRLAESLVIAEEKRLLARVVAMASRQPDMPSDPKDTEAQGSF